MKFRLLQPFIVILFFLTVVHLFGDKANAACLTSSTINGDQTVAASCSVAANTVESAQACTLSEASVNSGTITLTCTGGCVSNLVTIASGTTGTTQLLANSVTLNANTAISVSCTLCEIKTGSDNNVWVTDADADGWSSAIDTTFTATASGKRLRCLMRGTAADCNDAAYSETNTCYAVFYPAFYPAFGPYGRPYGSFYPQFSP